MNSPLRRALALLELKPSRVVAAVAAGVVGLGSGLALAAVAAWLIARAWGMPPVLELSVAVVCVRALGISRGLFRYLERLASHDTAFRATTAARSALYKRLASGDPAAVTGLRRGDVRNRTGADVDTVAAVVVRAIVPIAIAAVLGVAAVVLLGTISLTAAIILATSLVAAGVIAPLVAARAARLAETAGMSARAEYTEHAVTALDHAAELRVAGRLDDILGAAKHANTRATVATDRAALHSAIAAATMPLAMGASIVGTLVIGILLYGSGDMSPMALAILVLLPLASFEAVAPLPQALTALTQARVAATRIVSLLDLAGDSTASSGAPLPTTMEVRCSDLVSGWPGGKATAPVRLHLAIGSRTAVVGPSGSGKSTFLMTLAGLLEPVGGQVTVNGIPISDWDPGDVRRRITYFAEDAHIFDTSLLENLRVARGDLGRAEADEALRAVGLGDWLDGLADGVDTVLTGGDRAVSGGQRRRILLARAIVSPAEILLLDEPTEHLDDTGGADLLRALLNRRSGLVDPRRSVVVITHQLPVDHGADQVVCFDSALRENTLPDPENPRTFVGTRGRRWSEVGKS